MAVSGAGAWISHPVRLGCRWYLLIAYSVITVFGAEVPPGRPLTVCIAGLATQSLLSVQGGCRHHRARPPAWHRPVQMCQTISMCGRAASPGRMVRMSVPGAIWLALIPYVPSSRGVATYTVPVKF